MKIAYLYTAMLVSDLKVSERFYAKVIGRPADDHPQDFLIQWRGFGPAGIQLFLDPRKAGKGRMTLVVSDLARLGHSLRKKGLKLGPIQTGDFGKIAQLADPDGNLITLAEPPKSGHRNR